MQGSRHGLAGQRTSPIGRFSAPSRAWFGWSAIFDGSLDREVTRCPTVLSPHNALLRPMERGQRE